MRRQAADRAGGRPLLGGGEGRAGASEGIENELATIDHIEVRIGGARPA